MVLSTGKTDGVTNFCYFYGRKKKIQSIDRKKSIHSVIGFPQTHQLSIVAKKKRAQNRTRSCNRNLLHLRDVLSIQKMCPLVGSSQLQQRKCGSSRSSRYQLQARADGAIALQRIRHEEETKREEKEEEEEEEEKEAREKKIEEGKKLCFLLFFSFFRSQPGRRKCFHSWRIFFCSDNHKNAAINRKTYIS